MAWASAETYSEGEIHTIGVAMYDPDSAEMEMFASYYRDYIEAGFPVKFIFSGKIADTQAECDFIDEAKANGAEGIISFAGFADGLQDVIKTCEKDEIYYALGSNSVSDENYEVIRDNPWYMGSVGPDLEAVYEAGCDMTELFLDKAAGNIGIMSGECSTRWKKKQDLYFRNRQKNFQKQIRPQNSQIKMEWYMLRSVRDIQKAGTVLRILKRYGPLVTATLL